MNAAFHQLPQLESFVTQLPPSLQGQFRLQRTIALVGLMGAGKTSVGRRLAKLLNARFVDSDQEIEAAANMKIPEIFERFGEAYFRDGEVRVILRLLDGPPCVLATGGGAFVSGAVRGILAERALSVWLRADADTLFDRVRSKPGRPLLQTGDPWVVFKALHKERQPSYEKADVVVESTAGVSQNVMAERVVAAIRTDDAARAPEAQSLRENRA